MLAKHAVGKPLAIVAAVCLLALGAVLVWRGCFTTKYPNRDDVDSVFAQLSVLDTEAERRELLEHFINERLFWPDSAGEDEITELFLRKLADEYLQSEDPAIIDAVDTTKIEGGWGNYICVFYGMVSESEGFRKRLSENELTKDKVYSCVGTSFSKEEVDAFLEGAHK